MNLKGMEPGHAAVLGCGPAGLLAAEALRRAGWGVVVLSRKVKSVMPGAQYLHHPIPGLTNSKPDGTLTYVKLGTREGYANRVYGSPDAPCSWDKFPEGELPAWSLKDIYERLWERWEESILEYQLNRMTILGILDMYDLVVSTIPPRAYCGDSHDFHSQPIWVQNEAKSWCAENTIFYNGTDKGDWYRTSRIFGHGSTEYAKAQNYASVGYKPTTTNCDCLPSVQRQGRFGQWRKGVLVHHVWEEMNDALYAL